MGKDDRPLDPQTTSVSEGHDPALHRGSLKTPLYESSTFVFPTTAAGKRYFDVVYGGADVEPGEHIGFSYSRLDAPNLRVAEARLARWEETEDSLMFNSGMAAISTVFLAFLRPGDLILYSNPIYGGTGTLLKTLMTDLGVTCRPFGVDFGHDDLESMIDDRRLAMVYVETPANPTNALFDLAMVAEVARRHGAISVCDNTFLSPVWQKPVLLGIDLVIHSATKYLGGHSDLTAGAVCGDSELIGRLRRLRYEVGSTAQPSTAWLLTRSLETLQVRVERQSATATTVAAFLADHPKVASVAHLSLLGPGELGYDIYKRQCLGPGGMISFEVTGGEEGCVRFLDAMELVRLAVSLGGTESLASHPWSMTHSLVPDEEKMTIGVTPGLVRLSIGLEAVEDLIADLRRALDQV